MVIFHLGTEENHRRSKVREVNGDAVTRAVTRAGGALGELVKGRGE